MAGFKTVDSPLTKTQILALKYIDGFITQYTIPPSLNEIAGAIGLASKSAARYVVRVLIHRGAMEFVSMPGLEKRQVKPMRITPGGRAILDEFDRLNSRETPDNSVVMPEVSVRRSYISYGEDVIIRNPDICNGAARINGTEIPVWQIVKILDKCMATVRGGYDNVYAALQEYFPSLDQETLSEAVDYSLTHQEEIAEDTIKNDVSVSMV
jgi:uncharacterized protein (DUF433 family)